MFRKRSRRPVFEPLESRQLLAVTLKGDVLTIRGTNHDDLIDVQRVDSGPDAGMLQVSVNGVQKLFDDNYAGTGSGTNSFAKFDIQNVNGQAVEKLTVEAHGLVGQTDFDLLVDGFAAVQVPVDSNGDASIVYSSDPTGTEMPFPLSFPPIGSGTTVGGSSGLGGTVVRKFVI